MGIAAQFSKAMHSQIKAHAAWVPIANSYALGDYGLISDGVFTKLGNIAEFGVTFEVEQSPGASMSFASDATRLVKLVGGAEVDALPQAPIEAKLRIEFGGKNAFVAKADAITVAGIANVAQVATRLAKTQGWKRRHRVVRELWTARGGVIALSGDDHAALELSGRADALKLVELGKVEAGVTVSSEHHVGYSSVGQTGVVGLSLFRLRTFGDGARLLGPEDVEVEDEDGDELVSDL